MIGVGGGEQQQECGRLHSKISSRDAAEVGETWDDFDLCGGGTAEQGKVRRSAVVERDAKEQKKHQFNKLKCGNKRRRKEEDKERQGRAR